MPDLAALEVVLDPRKAEAGAIRAVTAIRSIGTAAEKMAATVNKSLEVITKSTRKLATRLAPTPEEAARFSTIFSRLLERSVKKDISIVGGKLGRLFGESFSKAAVRSVNKGVAEISKTLNSLNRPIRMIGIRLGRAFDRGVQSANKFERISKSALGQVNNAGKKLTSSGGGLAFLGGAGIAGLAGALGLREFISQTIEAGNAFQTVRAGLTAVFKDGDLAASTIKFLTTETTRLGASFVKTAPEFTKLAAAARQTGLTNTEVERTFTGVLEASRVFNLGANRTGLIFNALTQVLSKGRLQSEELRRQLGDSLPGAFEIAAKSLGVSTAELNKRLALGLVDARTFIQAFIPALQAEVEKGLPTALQSLQAQFQGFTNRIQLTLNEIAQGGFFDGITKGLQALSLSLGGPDVIPIARELGEVLGDIAENVGVKFAEVLRNVSKNAKVFFDIFKVIGGVLNIVVEAIKFVTQNAGLLRLALIAVVGIPIIATIKLFSGALSSVFGGALKQSINLVDLLITRLRVLNQTAKTTQTTPGAGGLAGAGAAAGPTLFGRPISGGGPDPSTRRGRAAAAAGSAGGLLAITVGLQAAKGPINDLTKGIKTADSEVNKFVRGGLRALPDSLNAAVIAFQAAPGPIGAVLAVIAGGATFIIQTFSDVSKAIEESNRKLTALADKAEARRQESVANTKARLDLESQLLIRAEKIREEGNATIEKQEAALRKVNLERTRVDNQILVEQGNLVAGINQQLTSRISKLEVTRKGLTEQLKTEKDIAAATANVNKEVDAQNAKVIKLGVGAKNAFIAEEERANLIKVQVDAIEDVNVVLQKQIDIINKTLDRERELIRLRRERRAREKVEESIQTVQPILTGLAVPELEADQAIVAQTEANSDRLIRDLQRRAVAIRAFGEARGEATAQEELTLKLLAAAEERINKDREEAAVRSQLKRLNDIETFNQRLINTQRDFERAGEQEALAGAEREFTTTVSLESRVAAAEEIAKAENNIARLASEERLQIIDNAERDLLATRRFTTEELTRIEDEFELKRVASAEQLAIQLGQIEDARLENTKSKSQQALDEIAMLAGDADAFIAGAFQSAFSSAEEAIFQFVRTGKVQFEDLIGSILDQLTRLAIQQAIIAPLAGLLGGQATPAGQGGGGAAAGLGSIGTLIGGLFSSGVGASTGGIVGVDNLRSVMLTSGQLARAQRFQRGGRVAGGGGPDSVPALLSPGEAVFTPGQVAALGAGGSEPMVVQNNISIQATDARSFTARRTQDQVSTAVAQSTERALNRNNINLRNR